MFKYNKEKNEYKSSFNNPLILIFSAFGSFILLSGVSAYLESPDELLSLGTAFIFVWSAFLLFMIYSSLNYFFRRIIINDNGVTIKNIIGSRKMTWEEIIEYGVAYSGMQRDGEEYYSLYFATENSILRTNGKRRFHGKTIKFPVTKKNLEELKFSVLPFCKKYLCYDPIFIQ